MSKMDKVKRLFRPGHDKDDETMYDTGNGDSNDQTDTAPSSSTHPTTTESAATTAHIAQPTASATNTAAATATPATTAAADVPVSREYLPNPVPPSVPGELDPVRSAVQDSELSKLDYTGITPGQTLADRVAERDHLAAQEEEEEKSAQNIHTPHDTSAEAFSGTAAAVATGAAAYEAGQKRDTEVDNATYTDRKFVVGGGPSTSVAADERPPIVTLPSMPHVPGEYPRGEEDIPPALKSNDPATIAAATAFSTSRTTADTESGTQTQAKSATTPIANEADRAITEQPQDHHLGRDTAVGVGGGAAAAAAYAAYEKTQDTPSNTITATQPTAPVAAATSAPIAEKTTASGAPQAPAGEHHYGRDAAVVGGAGALGAGAYAAHNESKDADILSQATPSQAHPVTTSPADTHPVTTSPETVRTTDDSHRGRDAAVVGGAGAVGAGAYATYDGSKDVDRTSQATPSHGQPGTAPDSTPVPANAETAEAVSSTEDKHIGRDAAVAGGAGLAGAGAYAAYEDRKDKDLTNQIQQPARTPSQPSTTAAPAKKTEARDAAIAGGAGAGGAGAYTAYEDEKDKNLAKQTQQPTQTIPTSATEAPPTKQMEARDATVASGGAGTPARATETASQTQQKPTDSHIGRDAAVAGGVASAGAGAYAVDREEKDALHDPAPTSHHGPIPSQAAHTSQPFTAPEISGESQSHAAITGAAIAGAGAAGVGAESALETHHGNKVITDTSGRNKLHKKGVEVPLGTEHSDIYAGGYDQRLVEQHGTDKSEEKTSFDRSGERVSRDSHRRSVEEEGDEDDQDSEHRKKHGLLSRIIHPNRTKREKAEELETRRHEVDAQEDVEEDAARITKGV